MVSALSAASASSDRFDARVTEFAPPTRSWNNRREPGVWHRRNPIDACRRVRVLRCVHAPLADRLYRSGGAILIEMTTTVGRRTHHVLEVWPVGASSPSATSPEQWRAAWQMLAQRCGSCGTGGRCGSRWSNLESHPKESASPGDSRSASWMPVAEFPSRSRGRSHRTKSVTIAVRMRSAG